MKQYARRLLPLIIAIATISAVYPIIKKLTTPSAASGVKFARIDVNKLLRESPDWSKYQELQAEVDKLRQKWATSNKNTAVDSDFEDKGEQAVIMGQIAEIDRMRQAEINLKAATLKKALNEYAADRQGQIKIGVNERFNLLNDEFNKEMQQKAAAAKIRIENLRRQLESEYQLTLANLQFQLALDALSTDQGEAEAEKNKVQGEIDRIKLEMERKTAAAEETEQNSLNSFAEEQKKAIAQEVENYKLNLEKEMRRDLAAYQRKLEEEFKDWNSKRNQDYQKAVELRKKNLQQDNSKMLIFQSQQRQIEDRILWRIKQKAKELARARRIDLIVSGGIYNNLPDLTRDFERALGYI